MIKLLAPANFGGENHPIGAVVNLSPLIENRMVENGYATRDIVEIVEEKQEIKKPNVKVGAKNEPKNSNRK